jgi:pimeloyl-ACP methyl ester carboxylesterase
MPFAQLTTGAQLHYEDTGSDKAPLLVIHGWLGTAALHFPRVTAWLEDRYRVIGPSLRGYGLSTPKPRRVPVDF